MTDKTSSIFKFSIGPTTTTTATTADHESWMPTSGSENLYLLCKGKYHCTMGLSVVERPFVWHAKKVSLYSEPPI